MFTLILAGLSKSWRITKPNTHSCIAVKDLDRADAENVQIIKTSIAYGVYTPVSSNLRNVMIIHILFSDVFC